jgi:peroxiredoxin
MRRWVGLTLVLLVAAACGGQREAGMFRPLQIGDVVPVYAVRTLAGDSLQVGGAGQPVTLLNVWATWCTECEAEMTDLLALHREFAPTARIVGVSVDAGDPSHVSRFAEKQGLTFSVALDREQRVKRLFQVVGVPTTFVIDRQGRLVWQHVGNLHPVRDNAVAAIREALEQS